MNNSKRLVLCLAFCAFITMLCACGSSGSGQKRMVTISINYPKYDVSALYDDDVKVYVDKIEIGSIKYGGQNSFKTELTDGSHTIYVRNIALIRKFKSNDLKINVSDEADCFEFEIVAGNYKKLKKKGD